MDLKKKIVLAVCAAFCVALIAGCSCSSAQTASTSSSQSTSVSDKPSTAQPQTSSQSTGTQAQKTSETIGTGSMKIAATNDAGLDFTTVAIKASSADTYAPENTYSNVVWLNGDSTTLCQNPIAEATASGAGTYDIQLTTADNAVVVVRQIDLGNISSMKVKFENGLGYALYTLTGSSQEISSQQAAETAESQQAQNQLPPDAYSQSIYNDK